MTKKIPTMKELMRAIFNGEFNEELRKFGLEPAPTEPDKTSLVYQKMKLLTQNELFVQDAEKIRDKWQVKKNKPMPWEGSTDKNVIKLIKKYKLPYFLSSAIYTYIIDGSITDNSSVGYPYCVEKVNKNNERELFIRIFPETTIKDIQKNWKDIEHVRTRYLGYDLKKRVKRKNLERDTVILRLKKSGNSYKKISQFINNEYPDQKISYQDVPKIIKRLGAS